MKVSMGDDVSFEAHLVQGLGSPLGETLLVVWQLLYSWPRLWRGRAKQPEDLENLINLLQRDVHTSGLAAQVI